MKFGAATSVFVYTLALVKLAAAHISIISPCPRYSPVGEKCPALPPGESYDIGEHAINGPISSVQLGGTMPLCRHTTPWPTPAAEWTAGQQVTIKFNPSAAIHSGGHCQFSISYDNGKTFAVIHEELQYCFLGSKPASVTNTPQVHEYSFTLPKNLPSSDKAVFSWTWINASGNREFYMNCADVSIKGSGSSYTGKQMVIANYPGYPTIPEFNGNYDTGMQYYKDAPSVTVSPSGGSSGGSYTNNTSSAAPSSAAPSSAAPSSAAPEPTTPANEEPTYTASSAPASYEQTSAPVESPNPHGAQDEVTSNTGAGAPADSGSGSCTAGQMQCSGSGYKVCIGGKWSQEFACGTGTACKGSDNGIYCGFS
ncbi:hypothetical protein IWW42_002760 [Coemansia sp. RSA 1085]|nr:hypothetical protein IWW42_002760 [Coemansia sp. RSA 1085]